MGPPEKTIWELYGKTQSLKCFGINTSILMYDGSTKLVQDVRENDLLMGPDSLPRKVTDLHRGKDEMFKVIPNRGESWICNKHHILSLKTSGVVKESHRIKGNLKEKRIRTVSKGDIINITLEDFIKKSKSSQRVYSLYRSDVVEFDPSNREDLSLDPYFLGCWLGDGSSRSTGITTMDQEIKELIYSQANVFGLSVSVNKPPLNPNKARTYSIIYGKKGPRNGNTVKEELKKLNLLNNKHIPEAYIKASKENRLQLLAGLLDTDGTLIPVGNAYSITQKSEKLSQQILFLARSLGFDSNLTKVKSWCFDANNEKKEGIYNVVRISGKTELIPVRLERKKAKYIQRRTDPMVMGFKLEALGEGNFYGFSVSGPDQLFLLNDFTVVHNSCISEHLAKNILEADEQNEVLFIYAEEPEMSRFKSLNVDMDRVTTLGCYEYGEENKLRTAEKYLDIAKVAVQDPKVKLVCIDSIKALCSTKQLFDKKGDIRELNEDPQMAYRARLISDFISSFVELNKRAQLLMLNQIGDTLGMSFETGPELRTRTPGGRFKEFMAQLRIEAITKAIYTEKELILTGKKSQIGLEAYYKITKNKFSNTSGNRMVMTPFFFNPPRFQTEDTVLKCAEYLNIIQKGAAGNYVIEGEKVRGEDKALKYIYETPGVMDTLKLKINPRSEELFNEREETNSEEVIVN
jgi:RecA/RadA recombinase